MAAKKTSKKTSTSTARGSGASKKVVAKKPVLAKNAATAKKTASKKATSTKSKVKKAPVKKAPPKKSSAAEASLAGAPTSLVGKKAPAFRLKNQEDQIVKSSSLAKTPYVLYFYPKDNTPGCTTESCDFRDGIANFQALGVTVLGVSPDSAKSHAGFANKYELPFTLLSDPDKELAQAYGVWALKKNYGREYWGIVRSTFLIGADGKVKKEWRGVRVKGHVEAVLEAAQA